MGHVEHTNTLTLAETVYTYKHPHKIRQEIFPKMGVFSGQAC